MQKTIHTFYKLSNHHRKSYAHSKHALAHKQIKQLLCSYHYKNFSSKCFITMRQPIALIHASVHITSKYIVYCFFLKQDFEFNLTLKSDEQTIG